MEGSARIACEAARNIGCRENRAFDDMSVKHGGQFMIKLYEDDKRETTIVSR